MARLVIWSDLHAHPFKRNATVLPNGMNSRLADAISCIDQIHSYADANGVDAVLFGGDFFHVRKSVSVAALNASYDALAKFAVSKIPMLLIHGNHDQTDRDGKIQSIYSFRTFLDVVDDPCWYPMICKNGEPLNVLAVPYSENVEKIRELVRTPRPEENAATLQLAHLGVQGAKVGADFVYAHPSDPTLDDLNPTAFDAVFLGHYHMHQQIGPNAWYIGAPMQHNFGDREQVRGFVVYDTDTREMHHIPLVSPRFVVCTEADIPDVRNAFVRLTSDKKFTDQDRASFCVNTGALSVDVLPISAPRTAVAPRLSLDPAQPSQDVLHTYVHSGITPLDGLDEEYLLQIGYAVMQEIEDAV